MTVNINVFSMLNFLLATLCIIGLTCYIQWRLKRRHLLKLAAKIPIPKNMSYYPLIGHAHHFIGDTESFIQCTLAFSSTSVYPMTVYLGHMVYHTIMRPEDLEIVLNSNKALAKNDLYKFTVALAGNSLLNLDVANWRRHRKVIAPTLNQKNLDDFVSIFAEQCRIMTDLLHDEIEKDFDISQFIFKCALDCILETAMGVKCYCQTTDNGIKEKINRGMEIAMKRTFNVALHLDFIFNLTGLAKEENEILLSFKSFVNEIVVERKNKYLSEKQLSVEQPEVKLNDTKTRNTFLDHLIRLSAEENKLTTDEITSEVQTFILAGSDTSATVAGFTLTCMALFPEIQQKVYEEITDLMGNDRDIEHTDLSKLKFTEMVIKESMRLFPVGPVLLRKVDEDLELETCTLPKEAGLLLNILSLHRHPHYFKDPLKFIPERFTPEESAKRHPYSYLPFSAGPRNCIGLKNGMMLTKVLVTSIVRKYFLSTDYKSIEEIRIKQSVVIKPVLGYKVHLTLRDD